MFQIATDIDVPPLTAADVAVRVDAGGRPVFVIPDDVARALRRAGKAGWREVPDWAYGEGDRYPTGGLVHTAASVLLEVARTLPVGVDHMDAKTRGQILRDAAVGSLYAFVVGRSVGRRGVAQRQQLAWPAPAHPRSSEEPGANSDGLPEHR